MGEAAALTVEHGNRPREDCARQTIRFASVTRIGSPPILFFDESIFEKILSDVKKNYTNSHNSSSGIGTFLNAENPYSARKMLKFDETA